LPTIKFTHHIASMHRIAEAQGWQVEDQNSTTKFPQLLATLNLFI